MALLFWSASSQGATRIEWSQPPVEDGYGLISYTSVYAEPGAAAGWQSISGKPVVGLTWWGCFSDYETDTPTSVDPPGEFAGDFDIWFWSWSQESGDIPGNTLASYSSVFPAYHQDWTSGTLGNYQHRFQFSLRLPWAFQTAVKGEKYFLSIQANYINDPDYAWTWWPSQTGLSEHPAYSYFGTDWFQLSNFTEGLAFNLSAAAKTVTGDYNGNGTADIAVFRPSKALWLIRGLTRAYFGDTTDHPVPEDFNREGNYDGDGNWDMAVFRPGNGKWLIRGLTGTYYGKENDVPIPNDYSGNDTADIAVFRPSHSLWLSDGIFRFYFGQEEDIPVVGDFTGNLYADPAIYRPDTRLWNIRFISRYYYGGDTDIPVPGDYDGDGTYEAGAFRPTGGIWNIRNLTRVYYGTQNDIPQAGDYNGDGSCDYGIYRQGLWSIRDITHVYYGAQDDTPVSNP